MMMLSDANNRGLAIERLLDREAFPHEVTDLQLLETHISWVILTGPFAYKIKKPVCFEFVDYSTLNLRKDFCKKEVELNRRFAPELYLGVVPIHEVEGRIRVQENSLQESGKISDVGAPIEYAVKMHQFSQDAIVAARLQHPELSRKRVDQFGTYISDFHELIERANPTINCVQIEKIKDNALENFATLRDGFDDEYRLEILKRLEDWTKDQFDRLQSKFQKRLASGFVRHCHGDMHLKNIIQIDDRLIAFDGIEFNARLQWIDVLSEIAFPVMDFIARDRADLGWLLLNSYLESCGDYRDLDVLRFYLVYRALVRAKVTWLNPMNHSAQESSENSRVDNLAGPWDKYLNAASFFAFELQPKLTITFGFSGSGKSVEAMKAIEKEGGVRIRSDVERLRLAKNFRVKNKYTLEMNNWVYLHLSELARAMIDAGWSVIVDATFLKKQHRNDFEVLAKDRKVDFQILACDAPFDELCDRIRCRELDASEATINVLREQMESHDPLTTTELQYVKERVT